MVHQFGLTGLLHVLRRVRGNSFKIDKATSPRERFSNIYETGLWKFQTGQPLSGAGSSEASAQYLIESFPKLLSSLEISSLLDIGCGDFAWMQKIDLPCSYVGIDIVPSVIAANTERFSTVDRSFLCIDATFDRVPTADAALCREVLFHLSFDHAMLVIRNVRRSGVQFFFATTDPITAFNSDIETGDFRILNLQKPPFKFGPPIAQIRDDSITARRIIGVWRVADFPKWTL